MPRIRKILIANRGEIALRIARTASEMGIGTVAVYSTVDRCAPHVRFADEAYELGPAAPAASYLRVDRILEVAAAAGVDAIHPGYGFLSENAQFAAAVEDAGLIFIGPSSQSIAIMGDKIAAKEAVSRFGVPLLPGTHRPVSSLVEAIEAAERIGYPLLIKASHGGGGKGMRVVYDEPMLKESLERATGEAHSAFAQGAVFIEKYVAAPRHIEFQVIGDQQGNVVHLFERECSIQRRYQKVIEEAPSSVLTDELRQEMGKMAVMAAKSCNYYNAGTVEFILDEDRRFYFLEMNTRLQVEHPVTEAITGLDLVRLQIEVAEGNPLPFSQEDMVVRGHAIEARIYAEDCHQGFVPDTGLLTTYRRPYGHGVRVDDGFEQGMSVTIHYDPMLGKLICYGATRQEAIEKMLRALSEYQVTGVQTTLDFCAFVMRHDAFRSGQFDTRFVERFFLPHRGALVGSDKSDKKERELAAAVAAHVLNMEEKPLQAFSATPLPAWYSDLP